jgi:hypothetical protein
VRQVDIDIIGHRSDNEMRADNLLCGQRLFQSLAHFRDAISELVQFLGEGMQCFPVPTRHLPVMKGRSILLHD